MGVSPFGLYVLDDDQVVICPGQEPTETLLRPGLRVGDPLDLHDRGQVFGTHRSDLRRRAHLSAFRTAPASLMYSGSQAATSSTLPASGIVSASQRSPLARGTARKGGAIWPPTFSIASAQRSAPSPR